MLENREACEAGSEQGGEKNNGEWGSSAGGRGMLHGEKKRKYLCFFF